MTRGLPEALPAHAEIWDRKPILRTIYNDFYDRILAACVPGLIIEIGAAPGHLKRRRSDVIATDIQFGAKLDCLADAQRLPFAPGVAANIVMVDVLHHIEFPVLFFREAERVLTRGGRVIMIEPAITWGSTLFYRLLHREPVLRFADPLIEGKPDPGRNPYRGNQAIPTLLATRDRGRFERLFPSLTISRVEWFSLAVYPLSGGIQPWSLISDRLARRALAWERATEPLVGRGIGFRMMLVVEKVSAAA
jgi:SAM-dependent methyltransferase